MSTELDPRARERAPTPSAPAVPLTVSRLAVWVGLLALAVMAVRTTLDPDLWWHLRTGEWILGRGLPREDVFSFTAAGREWVTHEWLAQVVMWSVWDVVGASGLMVLFGAMAVGTFVVVFRTIPGGPLLKLGLTALAARTAVVAFGARPQLFNLMFAAALVWLVEAVKDGRRSSRDLWWLVALTFVWANFHSGYLFGIVLMATYVVGDGLQRRIAGDADRLLPAPVVARLATITAVSFGVAAVNPSGPKLWIYPFVTLRSEAMAETIAEWQSPDFHDPLFWPFAAMLVLAMASLAVSRRRPTLTELLLLGGTAFAALQALRHVSLFAVVAAPIIGRHLLDGLAPTRIGPWLSGARDRRLRVGPIFTAAMAAAIALAGVVTVTGTMAGNDASIEREFPVAAVDWIESGPLAEARGFNSYGFGGYLIWRGHQVFVDGRADVYGDDLLWLADDVADGGLGWDDALDRYDVEYALVRPDTGIRSLLDLSDEWSLGYQDDVAVVYTRPRS